CTRQYVSATAAVNRPFDYW
nr:immunoglobulin heavy chain junction region [Macaca mulatta]